jgi:peptidoglycan/LPS O-acetylase OafA/YrhL
VRYRSRMLASSRNLPLYPGIDLLRALAAMLVLVYHVIRLGDWARLPESQIPFAFRNGWIGVDLFLVISGFVITLTAMNGYDKQGADFRRDFTRHRLARIVPLYFLTTLVFLILVNPGLFMLEKGEWRRHLVTHLLFVHNLHHSTHGSINGPAWSVALEMQYYLAMLFLTPWLARLGVARLLLVTLLGAAVWRYLTTLWWIPGVAPPIVQFIYQTQLPGVIDEFAMGMVLAMLVRQGPAALGGTLTARWRNCLGWLAVSAVLLGLAAWWLDAGQYWSSRFMLVAWRPAMAAGFAALLASIITFPAAGAAWLAPLRYLGQVSYGLYLWHMMVLLVMVRSFPWMGGYYLLAFVFFPSLALAAATWHGLEKPNLLRYKHRKPEVPA